MKPRRFPKISECPTYPQMQIVVGWWATRRRGVAYFATDRREALAAARGIPADTTTEGGTDE